jgi:hypothetical protein
MHTTNRTERPSRRLLLATTDIPTDYHTNRLRWWTINSPSWSDHIDADPNRGALLAKLARRAIAPTGTSNSLSADTGNSMLRRMRIPSPTENAESGLPHEPQCYIRLVRNALWRERRHTERLVKDQFLATSNEIGLLEKRMLAKLEDIDASVSLVAGELARRSGDPPSNGTGS